MGVDDGATASVLEGCAEVAIRSLALILERMLAASAGSIVRVSVGRFVEIESTGRVTVTVTTWTSSV